MRVLSRIFQAAVILDLFDAKWPALELVRLPDLSGASQNASGLVGQFLTNQLIGIDVIRGGCHLIWRVA